jgi:long-chain acyl-CoA synthetase
MPVDVLREFEARFHAPIYEGYGLTESTVSVACNTELARRVGSVGRPYPGVQARIVADDGKPVAVGERGELLLQGPNIMTGYLNRPKETEQVLAGGWLHTGDIGYLDEDGYLYIVDRKRDLIIKGGYNVYPREVEDVLYQLPQIAEAAVVGIQDAAKGEQVRAVIALRPGATLTESEIDTFLRERLAKYKLPNQYVFMSELPKGPSGKILKRELRALAQATTAGAANLAAASLPA